MAITSLEITQDNFEKMWARAIRSAAKVRRKALVKRLVKPISNLVFLLLCFLYTFGAFYVASGEPKDLEWFSFLGFLVPAWNWVAGLFPFDGLPWFTYWPAMLGFVYVLTLAVSLAITILVSIVYHPRVKESQGFTDAENGKNLYHLIDTTNKQVDRHDQNDSAPYRVVFIVGVAAFLVYGFMMEKIRFDVGMALGALACAAVLYFVCALLYGLLYNLHVLFYYTRPMERMKNAAEQYWLSVDPDEVERRAADAKRREQERERREAAARQQRAASSELPTYASDISKYDSSTWTQDYVRRNQEQCADVTADVINVSRDLLREGEYEQAAVGLHKAVLGLEMLKELDSYTYLSPLYANCYALCKVFAFGLGDRDLACIYAGKACTYAAESSSDMARRDLRVMKEFYFELRSSKSLSTIAYEFDIHFPADVLNMG